MTEESKFRLNAFGDFRNNFANSFDTKAQYFNSNFTIPRGQEIITTAETPQPDIVRKRVHAQEDKEISNKKQRQLRDAILLERKHAEALKVSLESHQMMVESYKSTFGVVDNEAQAMFKESLLELMNRWRRVVEDIYLFDSE